MLPTKLNYGDEIRIIAPSRSLNVVRPGIYKRAFQNLTEMGFKITFSSNCYEADSTNSSSISSRLADLHDAFSDSNVKAILTAIGGFNVNQLLPHIDYSIIQNNPKILCGYSDITALLNAVYANTELVTYHGTHFSSFGFEEHLEYTKTYFQKCLMESKPFVIEPSLHAQTYHIINPGYSIGTIIGGNLCTLNLLQGTLYMPKLTDAVLFIEDDNIVGEYFLYEFDRNLESLIQAVGIQNIQGIVFGRFDESCKMNIETISRIISQKTQLTEIPVLFNIDFGHVQPFMTFPIGGKVLIDATSNQPFIQMIEH